MARFICTAVPISEIPPRAEFLFKTWLAEGYNAGMEYLDRHHDLRRNPALLLDGSRTMIIAAFPYPGAEAGSGICPGIAAYALGDDYHEAIRDYLDGIVAQWKKRIGGEWRICIDSAPVAERFRAVGAGLARPTRSGNVAVEGLGTRFFLAEIISTHSLEEVRSLLEEEGATATTDKSAPPTEKEWVFRHPGPLTEATEDMDSLTERTCGDCRICLEVCPGRAIMPGGLIDARRCLSYLTIEHRGPWTAPEALAVTATPSGRNTLFGCDICLRACPLNHVPVPPGLHPLDALTPRKEYIGLTAEKIADMTQEEFSTLFRRSAIKRAKLAGLRRNALNCLTPHNP